MSQIHGNTLPNGEADFNELYAIYARNAEIKGRKFELSKEEARTLYKSDCYYCGAGPSAVQKRARRKSEVGFVYNGIDRVDNSKDYVLENCVACCTVCNHMKHVLSVEDFLNHVRRICEHRR